MGHRMKNYGLAAGPRSTMLLSVRQSRSPAYTADTQGRESQRVSRRRPLRARRQRSSAAAPLWVYYEVAPMKEVPGEEVQE